MSLRTRILLFLFIFALLPLLMAVAINLPLVLDRFDSFYRQAFLQDLRADFSDLDQHLASRDAHVRLLAKLPEPYLFDYTGEQLAQERERYIEWINRIWRDENDIVQVRFFDRQGQARLALMRDAQNQVWQVSQNTAEPLMADQRQAILNGERQGVVLSPVQVDLSATDPRLTMTLNLLAAIQNDGVVEGVVMMTVDIAGLVRHDLATQWVLDDGSYLQLPDLPKHSNTAFEDYPDLQTLFRDKDAAVWEQDGQRMIWVPMFLTQNATPLWVGRRVNMQPLATFRYELIERVLAIILGLVILLWFSARILAKRAEQISTELITGIQQTLDSNQAVEFAWRDTKELRQLSSDLTELSKCHAQQTQNLLARAQELEQSNRYKSEFLANVSHELRTPLNSILLLSKLLAEQDSGLSAERREQAQVVHKAGKDLKALIDDILDLSKIEAGQLTIHQEPIMLADLLEDIHQLLAPQFAQQNLPLRIELATDAPKAIESDPDKIRQVLKNFLANALKFTRQGEVLLKVESAQAPYQIAFHVQDTGIGIAPDKLEKIFEAFQQEDGSTSRRYGGTGLGLTISRQLAHLLGGEITLQSTQGEGSRFSLLLPLGEISSALPESTLESVLATDTQSALDLHGLCVLLMDGDIKTQLQLSQCLQTWQGQLALANDLPEALETLQEINAAQLLLVDPTLPGLDLYATIEQLKQQQAEPLPVVLLLPPNVAQPEMPDGLVQQVLHKPMTDGQWQTFFRGNT
jgi:signal transduction histidine kinase